MRLGKISMAALAVLSMAGTPLLAQSTAASSKASVSAASSKSVRTDGMMSGESEARGGSLLLALGAISMIVLGVTIAATSNSKPKSP